LRSVMQVIGFLLQLDAPLDVFNASSFSSKRPAHPLQQPSFLRRLAERGSSALSQTIERVSSASSVRIPCWPKPRGYAAVGIVRLHGRDVVRLSTGFSLGQKRYR